MASNNRPNWASLAAEVTKAEAAFGDASDNVIKANEAYSNAASVVDKLEQSLLSLDGQAARLSREQAELVQQIAEATNRRDAFRDLVSATGGKQGGQGLRESSAELSDLQKQLDRTQAGLGMLAGRAADAADSLTRAKAAQNEADANVGRALASQEKAGQGVDAAQKDKAGAGSVGTGDVIGAAMGGMTDLLGVFSNLAGSVGKFVGALNPSLMEMFGQTLKDVTAVIGVALEPLMVGLNTLAREVGDMLLPVMRSLQPVVAQVTRAMLSVLLPAVQGFGLAMQILTPIIKFAADVFEALVPLIRAAQVVITGFQQAFVALLGKFTEGLDSKSWTDWLKESVQTFAKQLILLAAHIAKFFGATSFIDGLIRGAKSEPIAKRESSGGLGAPQAGGVNSLSGVGDQIATAAFVATGSLEKEKKTEDWLKDIAGDLGAIKDRPAELLAILEKMLTRLEKLPETIGNAVVDGIVSRVPTWAGGAKEHLEQIERNRAPIRRRADGTLAPY